jgi:phosphoenolpyruvate---glycerone phosphotransferase subunit DhaL
MAEISQADIERAIKTTCATVLRNEHYFADLDGLAGDGDFGTSLATGFRQIEKEWDEIPKTDIGAMLLKISMIVSKHVGGSSGPIWGTGFMKAAMLTRGKSEIELQDLAQMLGSAIEGIQARGGAQLGDKTLLDALIPFADALETNVGDGQELAAAWAAAAEKADEGAKSTTDMRPRVGRARPLAERSVGNPDPGAVSMALSLAAIGRTIGQG